MSEQRKPGVTRYELQTTRPAWQRPVYSTSVKDQHGDPIIENYSDEVALWSGEQAPPTVGTKVTAYMNNLGPATVKGYFIEHGWLGVYLSLRQPPEWWKRQTRERIARRRTISAAGGVVSPPDKTDRYAMLFGCEIEPRLVAKAAE
jgi:hypothetical protein